jgi:hypothetical protein
LIIERGATAAFQHFDNRETFATPIAQSERLGCGFVTVQTEREFTRMQRFQFNTGGYIAEGATRKKNATFENTDCHRS